MKRQWLDRGEGEHPRYFRNANLVMNEQERTPFWHPRQGPLREEWHRIFSVGVDEKDALDRGDVAVSMRPFRETCPDKPWMWVLDKPMDEWGPEEEALLDMRPKWPA